MKLITLALMTWINAYNGLPIPQAEPTYVYKEKAELCQIMYQQTCQEVGVEVQAMFSDGVIFLPKGWEPTTPLAVAQLLHELVHFMQFHAGVPLTPCVGEALEKPAYDAHFAFLRSMKLDPMKMTGINELMLFFVTNCVR